MNTNPLTLTPAEYKAKEPEVQDLYKLQVKFKEQWIYDDWELTDYNLSLPDIRFILRSLPPIIDKTFYEGLEPEQKALYAKKRMKRGADSKNYYELTNEDIIFGVKNTQYYIETVFVLKPSPAVPVQPQEEKQPTMEQSAIQYAKSNNLYPGDEGYTNAIIDFKAGARWAIKHRIKNHEPTT